MILLPAETDNEHASTAASSLEVKQTTQFTDNYTDPVQEVPNIVDSTFDAGDTPMYDLNSYLSRPIVINKLTWDVGSDLSRFFSPFSDLIKNKNVFDRISTYAYMRGKVKVKFVINGSPFWYGRAIAAVVPFPSNNEAFIAARFNKVTANNYLSQLDHVFLDPNSSNSVEIELQPYIVRNWIRLATKPLGSIPGDFATLPAIYLSSINPLINANSASTGSVQITVLAWFEDLKLAVPTGSKIPVTPTLVENQGPKRPQKRVTMGKAKVDQESQDTATGKPSISGVASTVSTGLNSMTSVPVIGPFMKAGAVASGAVSSIAKLFGFSRPTQLYDTHRFLPEAIPNLSATGGAYSGYKMSIDPLQGVTVDPRVALKDGSDELSLANLASRSAYFHTFPLEANTTVIGSMLVTPLLTSIVDVGAGGKLEQLTPTAFAAYPFNYWRGTIKLKFQVVASSFHKARIAIIYDPYPDASNIVGARNLNSHLNLVMDLEELDELELDIPWMSAFPYLKTSKNLALEDFKTPDKVKNGTVDLFGPNDENNGIIQLVVINELVSTQEPVSPVFINVFVSCPDLQVGFLDAINRKGWHARPSLREAPLGDVSPNDPGIITPKEDDPSEDPPDPTDPDDKRDPHDPRSNDRPPGKGGLNPGIGPDPFKELPQVVVDDQGPFGNSKDDGMKLSMGETVANDQFPMVFFGEDIKSFRTILKRFGGVFLIHLDGTQTGKGIEIEYSPLMQTTFNGGLLSANNQVTVSPWIHPMEYLRFSYFAQRGGIRSYYSVSSKHKGPEYHHASTVQSLDNEVIPLSAVEITQPPFAVMSGSVANPAAQNDSLSFETPFYTSNRYLICCDNQYGLNLFGVDEFYPKVVVDSIYSQVGSGTTTNSYDAVVSMAAADDFSFMGFMGAPSHGIRQ